jgi:hypothetical protein
MKNKTLIKFVVLSLLALFSAGCLNYEQETFLNDDFSGRTEMRLSFNPKSLFNSALQKIDTSAQIKKSMEDSVAKAKVKIKVKEESFLENVNKDALKNKTFVTTEKDGTTYFCFSTEFNDIRKLYEGKREVSITEDKTGLTTYTEYFNSLENDKTKEENLEIYKGCSFKYVLHLPRDIVKANTDKIDKNTAVWELPLEQVAANRGFYITATMKSENKFLRWLRHFKKKKK